MTRTPKLRFLSALLAVAMMLTFLPTGVVTVFAADTTFTEGDWDCTVNDDGENTVTIVPNDNTDTSTTTVTIPSTVVHDGVTYSVTAIGDGAFSNRYLLSSVEFEEGSRLKTIGNEAFYGLYNLTSITLPDSVTSIGNDAFSVSGIKKFTFPSKVTTISDSVFEGSSLEEVTIPSSVTSIENQAFLGCTDLKKVKFTGTSHLQTIGDEAFGFDWMISDRANLEEIEIPASVTSIGAKAFAYNDKLTKVTFGKDYPGDASDQYSHLQKIGDSAFASRDNSSLTEIEIPASVKEIGDSAFANNQALKKVTFGETTYFKSKLATIGGCAFDNCGLESIIIPKGVSEIGFYTLGECSNLKTVAFEEGSYLKTLGESAFAYSGLTSITLPKGVNSINGSAFNGCNSLTKITYGNTKEQWDYAGGYVNDNVTLVCAYKATFKDQNGIERGNVLAFEGDSTSVPSLSYITSNPAFAGWSSSNPEVLTLEKNQTIFTMPAESVTFTAKMKQTPTADMFEFTSPTKLGYDGSDKEAKITPKVSEGAVGNVTLKYYENGNQVTGYPKLPGTYTVKIDVAEGSEYLAATDLTDSTWKFTITKKSPNVSGLTITVPADLTYDGNPKEVTATPNTGSGITAAEVIYYEGESTTAMTEKPTNAGTYRYEVKVTGDNTTDDQTLKDDSWTFTIVKADPKASDFTFTSPANLTYDGTEKAATVAAKAGINGMGSVSLKYYKGKNQVQGTPKDAGTYTVKIDVAEGDNYKAANDLTDSTWKFTIAKKTPTASDLTIKRPTNLVYDGTPKTVMVTPKENSGITRAEVNYYDENNNKLTGEPTNAGTYKYNIKLTGDSNTNNSSITNGAWQFTITKATPDVSDFTFAPPTNLTYDGNAKEATVEVATGVTGMGTLSTTKYYKVENGVEEEVTENNGLPTLPGTYKVKISVDEGENYKATTSELTADDWTFTIGTKTPSKGDIKDPVIPNNPTYDGTEKKVSVEPADGSVIDPNDVEVVYVDKDNHESTVAPKNAGDYTFKIKIKADPDGKYTEAELTDSTWTFTIEKAAPDASDFTFTAPSDLTYDGTAKTATVEVKTGINGMGDVILKYFDEDGNPLQGTPKNAGTYTVKIDAAEGDNYKAGNDLSGSAWTFTISKADLTKDDFELKSGNVSLKDRIDGAGTVRTTYKRLDENGNPTGDDLDTLPTDDGGVYQIYVTTKGGSNYNDLTTPTTDTSWTIRQDGKDRDLKGEGFVAKVNGTESKTAKWGQTVEIEPGEVPTGKKFKEWKIDGATLTDPDTTEKNSFVMGNSDVTITAVYEDIEYTLTVGGKTEKHLYNETVTLKDTPEAGMELDYWEVDGNKITGSTFPMPAKNVTAEAVYKAKSYTLTVDGKTEDHLYGSDVSVTAPAKDGYKFTGWTVEGVDVADKTSETLKFQMPAGNVTLTPSYEKIQTPVKPNPGEGEDPGSKPADPKPGKPETEKKTLTAEDFVFTAPSDNTADGTAKEASVSAKADGAGKITLKYYDEAGNLLDKAPTEPGSYTVRVDVAESDTCKALKDLTAPGWEFTIEKAKPVTSEISIDNGKAYLEDGETEINTAEAGQTVVVRVNPEAITEGFAFDKWEVVSGGITLEDETSPEIRFVMPAGKVELKATVKVKQTPSTALSPLEQAAATTAEVVVVGAGVAALGVSVGHIATELYLKWVLPAGIIPANREQLALLLWNKEDQPAADSTELYTDISADDTDAQTAAHWVIESGLMDLVDGDEADVFEPDKPVTVYEVAAAWNKKPAQSR